MHTTSLPRPLRLSRAWPLRWADRLVAQAVELVRAWRAAWRNAQQRRRERLELQAAADLSDAMLRDMGAPDWLQAQAEARRAAQRFDRELLQGGSRAQSPYH